MVPSEIFNSSIKVKEEPSEVLFTECEDEMTEESTDHRHFQLLPFRDNSHDENRESEVNHVESEFECVEEKPNKSLLALEKRDGCSRNDLQNVNDSNGCEGSEKRNC